MRLFIGIALDASVRARLAGEIRDLRGAGAAVRWCAPETIHLTLKFIGERDGDEAVAAALEGLGRGVPPMDLRITGLGCFGRGAEVRVVWAGIEPLPALTGLHERIEAALQPLGIAREERPWTPHVTLGRGKGGDGRPLLARIEARAREPIAVAAVGAFQLFASRLTPQGPVHAVRREYPLG